MLFKRYRDSCLVRMVARWRIRQIVAWTKRLVHQVQLSVVLG